MIIIDWIGSKLFYAKLKIEIYRTFKHGDEWIKFLTNLAIAYKDATPETIKKEFVGALAEKVHNDNSRDKEKKDSK